MEITVQPCPSIFSHINRYVDRSNNCVAAKLMPGEYYISDKQEMITTVLGSCVSACIYDEKRHIGGMNHFMLPAKGSAALMDESARYGLFAMESLINELMKSGCRKQDLKVKLFGGGQIIANMSDVGRKNILFAKNFLHAEGLPLEASDLGLIFPRKVNFFPFSGKAMVKRLKTLHNDTITEREKQYAASLRSEEIAGDIELF
jgi:chemotaxis protein CheD